MQSNISRLVLVAAVLVAGVAAVATFIFYFSGTIHIISAGPSLILQNVFIIVAAGAGGIVGVVGALITGLGTARTKAARQTLSRSVNIVALILTVLTSSIALLTLLNAPSNPVAPIRIPITLAALAAIGILVGKFVLGAIIVPIVKSIPALIFGIFARDWWEKRKAHKDKTRDPQT